MKAERADANCVQTKIAKQKFRARGFGILVPRKNRYADRFFRRDFAEWHTRDLSSHVKGLYDQAVADVSEVDVRGGTAAPTYGLGNRAADFWFAKCAVSFGHRTMCSGGALASKPLQNSKAPNGMERGQNHKKETPTEIGASRYRWQLVLNTDPPVTKRCEDWSGQQQHLMTYGGSGKFWQGR